MPSRRQVRMMRTAISPRLATSREPIIASHPVDGSMFGQVDLARSQREAETHHVPRLPRLDDSVVPEPGGRIIGRALGLELSPRLAVDPRDLGVVRGFASQAGAAQVGE